MRSDFEQLLWLYSMGVEDVATRMPQNYFNVRLEKKINDSAYQNGPLLKKSEENEKKASNIKKINKTFSDLDCFIFTNIHEQFNMINFFFYCDIFITKKSKVYGIFLIFNLWVSSYNDKDYTFYIFTGIEAPVIN